MSLYYRRLVTLAVSLLVATLIGGLAVVFYLSDVRTERATYENLEKKNLDALQKTIRRQIATITTDLMILARSRELQRIFAGDSAAREDLGSLFFSFAAMRKSYDQLGYIDEKGAEIVRADYNDGDPALVDTSGLSDKNERYYFREAMELDNGEVYVSPFDLNKERGEIETPFKTMIRFATPVFDEKGARKGVVILNFPGERLIDMIDDVMKDSPGKVMLLNAGGRRLHSPRSGEEWGFMLKDKAGLSFAARWPEQWRIIASSDSGQLLGPSGLVTYSTFYPLVDGHKAPPSAGDRAPGGALKRMRWKIVSIIPTEAIRTGAGPLFGRLVLLYTALALALAAGSFLVDSSIARSLGEHERLLTPFVLLVSTSIVIILGDMMVMLILPFFEPLPPMLGALVDSALLFIIVMPTLYIILFRPLINHIERRRQAEEALRESEKKYRTLIETADDAIVIVDRTSGRIIGANQAAERLTGHARTEIIGQPQARLFPGEMAKRSVRLIEERGERGRMIPRDILILHSEGHRIPVDVRSSVIESDGRPITLEIFRDVRHRKLVEDTLREIAVGFSSVADEEFFDRVTSHLAGTLDVAYAMVAELCENRTRCLAFAVNARGRKAKPFTYELAGTPCELVISPRLLVVPEAAPSRFPDDPMLAEMNIESYVGAPLFDSAGEPSGVLALMDTKPLANADIAQSLLKIFAERVSSELERKKAVARLKEAGDFLQTLIDNIPNPVFYKNTQGVYLGCNKAFEELVGESREQVVGKTLHDLIKGDRAEKYRQKDWELLHGGGVQTFEVTIRTAAGEDREMMIYRACFTSQDGSVGGLVGVMLDITDRKRIEEHVRSTKLFLEKVMETTFNALFVLDLEGRFTMANQSCAMIYGCDVDELIGANLATTLGKENLPRFTEQLVQVTVFGAPVTQHETEITRKDGSKRHIIYSLAPMYIDGHITSAVGSAADISDRKKIEKQREALIEDLERVNMELGDFAYVVSHDLKAPLRGISSLAEWTLEDYGDKLDKEGRENLELMLGRSRRMINLINGILQYSRVGRLKPILRTLDVEEVVREVIDSLAPPDHIAVRIEGPMPHMVYDHTHLTQIFQNLISNAINNMDKPRGSITVSCEQTVHEYLFRIRDNGPGIEKKHFERIFKIFQSLRARDETEATGIGLTLVKKIVESHGGAVWLTSAIAEGSEFCFTIPKALQPNIEEITEAVS